MILYVDSQYISPYAMSAFVGLTEKHLAFELHPVDLQRGIHHAPPYAAQSLTQRIPTLVHGDFALSESSAITEYLDELFPGQPLYPSDPQLKARARQIQAWLRSDLLPLRSERPTEVIFRRFKAPPLSAAANVAAEKLFAAAMALLKPEQPYLFADWCIADSDLALMLNRLVFNGDEVPQALADYAQQQWQRPSIQSWLLLSR